MRRLLEGLGPGADRRQGRRRDLARDRPPERPVRDHRRGRDHMTTTDQPSSQTHEPSTITGSELTAENLSIESTATRSCTAGSAPRRPVRHHPSVCSWRFHRPRRTHQHGNPLRPTRGDHRLGATGRIEAQPVGRHHTVASRTRVNCASAPSARTALGSTTVRSAGHEAAASGGHRSRPAHPGSTRSRQFARGRRAGSLRRRLPVRSRC
jgi:hypothetical protein